MVKLFVTKVEKLLETGQKYFKKKINLSRKKFIISCAISMCMSRSVQFPEIAQHLNNSAEVDSNLRRIQAFFSDYELNYEQIAIILISFIPKKKYRICIDRTNWTFGSTDINIFALTIYLNIAQITCLQHSI